ncbi:hypothetical protein R1sor_026857 [Riccia sorocarpa]|uniref:Endonuclease/exonuclease/phosphatase domain-containing protein n=1 Tax=Riccia sorocarpa TaxID=122646 RepID=A0ABD3GIC7_9MARC
MRRRIVKNFITRQYRDVDIIALQELKVLEGQYGRQCMQLADQSGLHIYTHQTQKKKDKLIGSDEIHKLTARIGYSPEISTTWNTEDSNGKSALMQGSEERAWRRMVNRTDSIDAYMAAVCTKGGLFTRMAFCGQRYDQARLDHFCLSNRTNKNELRKRDITEAKAWRLRTKNVGSGRVKPLQGTFAFN